MGPSCFECLVPDAVAQRILFSSESRCCLRAPEHRRPKVQVQSGGPCADVPSEVDPCSHITEGFGGIWFDVWNWKRLSWSTSGGSQKDTNWQRLSPVSRPLPVPPADAEGFVGESGDWYGEAWDCGILALALGRRGSGEYAPTVVHVLYFPCHEETRNFLEVCRTGVDGWTPRTPPHPLHPQIATVFGAQLGHTARTPRQALRPGRQADPRPGADKLARKAQSGDDSKGVPACEHPAGHDDSSQALRAWLVGRAPLCLWTLPFVVLTSTGDDRGELNKSPGI